ncbi:EAL domain-containing protein [Buttiauxella brennerae]|uniref:EAL domain-containing protein n=1 Tax=Buttiauxella brennerae TaxID=82988 RepID=UPI00286ECE2F|nr:EAL domain-containing protein [Buttiauxella brennerae]
MNKKHLLLVVWVVCVAAMLGSYWEKDTVRINETVDSYIKSISEKINVSIVLCEMLRKQMEINLQANNNYNPISIPKKDNNPLGNWHFKIIPHNNVSGGMISGLGSYDDLDPDTKNEANAAASLNIDVGNGYFTKLYSWIYYTSKNSFVYIAPYSSEKKVSTYYFNPGMYTDPFWKLVTPENNPKREVKITTPYIDIAGKGQILTVTAPVYNKDEFKGAISLDLNLNYVNQIVKNNDDNYHVTVFDKNKKIIISSEENASNKSISSIIETKDGFYPNHTNKEILSGILYIEQHTTLQEKVVRVVTQAGLPIGIITFIIFSFMFFQSFSNYNFLSKRYMLRAMKKNEFIPYAQAIMDSRSKNIIGCEILLRWEHPTMGLISPNTFIPTMESTGIIVKVTHQLLENVQKTLHHKRDKLPENFHLSINISPEHLEDPELVTKSKSFKESCSSITTIFEITERNFNADAKIAIKGAVALKDINILFALDDFGTGYATHHYLQKFPVSYIKIDRSFIKMIGLDAISHHIVENVVSLSKSLNLKVIAEGVETEEQAKYLQDNNVDYQQGFLYHRPVPLSEFLDSLGT